MLHPARLVTALLVFLLALGLRGLVGDLGSQDEREASRQASAETRHNLAIARELGERWQLLPQSLEARAGYSSPEGYGVLTGYAVCERCNRRNLVARLVGDVWRSDLQGITSIKISVAYDDDRAHPVTETFDPERDAQKLYDRYGNGLVDPDEVDAG